MRRFLPFFCVLACCGSDADTSADTGAVDSTGADADSVDTGDGAGADTDGVDAADSATGADSDGVDIGDSATGADTDDGAGVDSDGAGPDGAETSDVAGADSDVAAPGDTASDAATEVEAAPVCGDGERAASEACDDHNEANGDGCSDRCTVSRVRTGEYGGTAILDGSLSGTNGSCTLILRGTAAPDDVHFTGRCIGGQAGALAALTGVDLGSVAFSGGRIGFDGATETVPQVTNGVVNAGTPLDATIWSGVWAPDAERLTVQFSGQRPGLALVSVIELVSPPPVICGDGVVEGDEECDFAAPGTAHCTPLCTRERTVDGTYTGTLQLTATGAPNPGTCSTPITVNVVPGGAPEISSAGSCTFDFGPASGAAADFTLSGTFSTPVDAVGTLTFPGIVVLDWAGAFDMTGAANAFAATVSGSAFLFRIPITFNGTIEATATP